MYRPFDQNKLNNANLRIQSQEAKTTYLICKNHVPQFFGYKIGYYNWYYSIPYPIPFQFQPFVSTANTPQNNIGLNVIPFSSTGFGTK